MLVSVPDKLMTVDEYMCWSPMINYEILIKIILTHPLIWVYIKDTEHNAETLNNVYATFELTDVECYTNSRELWLGSLVRS